jgi:hypothetical protein
VIFHRKNHSPLKSLKSRFPPKMMDGGPLKRQLLAQNRGLLHRRRLSCEEILAEKRERWSVATNYRRRRRRRGNCEV